MATYFGGKYNLSLFVISFKMEDFAVNFSFNFSLSKFHSKSEFYC